jgi:hypothetical protein
MRENDYTIGDKNISQIIKEQKVNFGLKRWYDVKNKFNITIYEHQDNNIIIFTLNGVQYYYGIPSQKIRRKGEREWTSKVITFLKEELKKEGVEVPVKEKTNNKREYLVDGKFTFGKYKGLLKWEVLEKDSAYFMWCCENIKGFKTQGE